MVTIHSCFDDEGRGGERPVDGQGHGTACCAEPSWSYEAWRNIVPPIVVGRGSMVSGLVWELNAHPLPSRTTVSTILPRCGYSQKRKQVRI